MPNKVIYALGVEMSMVFESLRSKALIVLLFESRFFTQNSPRKRGTEQEFVVPRGYLKLKSNYWYSTFALTKISFNWLLWNDRFANLINDHTFPPKILQNYESAVN